MSAKKPAMGKPAYSVSQNFLTSRQTINRLLNRTNISQSDYVLEIGAGKGHITRALLGRCGALRAVEIDPSLCNSLRERCGAHPRLQLVRADFLKTALPTVPYKVFSNIPFSITTAIMRKLLHSPNPPQEGWLFMEKGAAKRFAGIPRETTESLALKPYYEMAIDYHFRREDFHPMPSVDVVMLRITRKANPDLPSAQRARFCDFVSRCQSRGLRAVLTSKQIATALKRDGLAPLSASDEILYIQWLCLFRCHANLN